MRVTTGPFLRYLTSGENPDTGPPQLAVTPTTAGDIAEVVPLSEGARELLEAYAGPTIFATDPRAPERTEDEVLAALRTPVSTTSQRLKRTLDISDTTRSRRKDEIAQAFASVGLSLDHHLRGEQTKGEYVTHDLPTDVGELLLAVDEGRLADARSVVVRSVGAHGAKDATYRADRITDPVVAAMVERALRGTTPHRRHRWPLAVAAAVATLLIAVGVVLATTGGDDSRPSIEVSRAGSATSTVSVPTAGRRVVLTIDNRLTSGDRMREDDVPVTLVSRRIAFCGSPERHCVVPGTDRISDATYDGALCQTSGQRITNGEGPGGSDAGNPERVSSDRYYGVRLENGRSGYVSEVWITRAQRGGLGLPEC